MHILLHPETHSSFDYYGSKKAVINSDLCTECGICEENCRFDAAHPPEINPISCEGCGVCAYLCPEGAISMEPSIAGHLFSSTTRFGPMAHAKLNAGEGNSGKLVPEVRKLAEQLAKENDKEHILIDGSPGIGCPVISTVTDLSLAIIVTEPTPSGLHDMTRVIDLLDRFNIPGSLIVNKFDLNRNLTKEIEQSARMRDVDVLGRIPFDAVTTKSMVATMTLPEYAPEHLITKQLENMWDRVLSLIK